jgi:ammonium transporter, Amt family
VGAVAIGALAGVLCHLLVGLKAVFRVDDALDVAAVHLGGGVIGALSIGLFATKTVNPAVTDGLFYGGGYRLLGVQAMAVGAVVGYSLVMTLIITGLTNRLLGNRVTTRDEAVGLDLSQHGESAYAFTVAQVATARAAVQMPAEAGRRERDNARSRT